MEWFDFVSLMKYMVETYGVPFGYSDESHEYEYPKTEEDCQSAWFECCECSEPIYFCDWKDELVSPSYEWQPENIHCPICEGLWVDVDEMEGEE